MIWRSDKSGPRLKYFSDLQRALHKAGVMEPVLIIDKARLANNITQLRSDLPEGMSLRLVAKSLPVSEILQLASQNLNTHRYMTFNRRMLHDVAAMDPDADQLLGKPLPVAAAAQFLTDDLPPPAKGCVHWLIDSEVRFDQYLELARSQDRILDIVLELDVGLHRGGFSVGPDLSRVLEKLRACTHLRLNGFMGYDAHVAKAPELFGLRRRAHEATIKVYSDALALARQYVEAPLPLRNAAGSPTFRLYGDTQVANEVAVGSALLKPTDFDTDLLAAYAPALFVAAPALKVAGQMRTPVLEAFDPVKRLFNPNLAVSIFIHGGHWNAVPCDPPGLSYNATYGRSSNQEVLNGGVRTNIGPDDFVFFRPTQSEATLMQFGQIAVYDDGVISGSWAPFPTSV